MKRITTLSNIAMILVGAGSIALVAQDTSATITGTVRGKDGKAIAGAEITISSPTVQGSRIAVTDTNGFYRVPLLTPGTNFSAVARKAGFTTTPLSGIELNLGATVRLDITMAPEAGTTVEVVATAGAVDKSDVKTSTSITSEKFDILPRTTRGLNDAALISPGVTTGAFQDGGRLSIRGQQGLGTRFLLNGTDIGDNIFGGTTGRGSYYVDDSIAEIQVIQSPVNAKFGGFSGGVVQAISKAGGNDYSGVIRANISRNSWQSVVPLGQRFAISSSRARTNPGADQQNLEYTAFMGGPIVKDKLWFTFSTVLTPGIFGFNTISPLAGNAQYTIAGAYGIGITGLNWTGYPGTYPTSSTEQFYQGKLTWSVNSDHTLELELSRRVNNQIGRAYFATVDPRTYIPQTNLNELETLGYKGVLSSNTTLELRISNKKQNLTAGGSNAAESSFSPLSPGGSPIYNYVLTATGQLGSLLENNGWFNANDGGDTRVIKMYSGNINHFINNGFLGSHNIDLGFEYTRQERTASNDQSPTSTIFSTMGHEGVAGNLSAPGPYIVDVGGYFGYSAMWNYYPQYGTVRTNIDSLYFNDLITFNKNHQFMFGVRLDRYKAIDIDGATSSDEQKDLSPRLQYRYDLNGDQKWLFTVSQARYVQKLGDGFTNIFTKGGKSFEADWAFKAGIPGVNYISGGNFAAVTYAQLTNRANYMTNNLAGLLYVFTNQTSQNQNVKAPYSDETSIGFKHNWDDGSFLGVTYNVRTTKNQFSADFRTDLAYNESLVNIPGTTLQARYPITRWRNFDDISRDYKSIELEFSNRVNRNWVFAGNWSLSSLKGNSNGGGEGGNPPNATDPIGRYTDVHTLAGRTMADYAPYGYLAGHQKHRAFISLSYVNKSAQGSGISVSGLFNYFGGSTYSLARAQYFRAQELVTYTSQQYLSYPDTYNQFYGARGVGQFNDSYRFDLKASVDYPLVARARFFAEITVFGLFNNWQTVSYLTNAVSGMGSGGNPANGASATAQLPAGQTSYRARGFTASSLAAGTALGYGLTDSASFAGGRSIRLSTGFKW